MTPPIRQADDLPLAGEEFKIAPLLLKEGWSARPTGVVFYIKINSNRYECLGRG